MEQRDWHFMRGDRECGPVTRAELREMLDTGDLPWTTRVRSENMPDWAEAQAVGELLNHHRIVAFDGPVVEAQPVEMASNVADFFWRFTAIVFDNVLVIAAMVGIEFLVAQLRVRPLQSSGGNTFVFLILGWFYFASLESTLGSTVGKAMVGLMVRDVTGKPISFQRATGRYFAKILSALPLYFGFIIALFTQKGQALHDLIAGTVIVPRPPVTKEPVK